MDIGSTSGSGPWTRPATYPPGVHDDPHPEAEGASAGRASPPARGPRCRMSRHPFAAVNLISDPIHGYIELTKRLAAAESAEAGLPVEGAAEEDLLDSAWLQRMRRISQLQSARWVFPTAEHSRFTHGLGVMHEAGLWARHLYPSLHDRLGVEATIGRAGGRDAPDRRAPPRCRPRAVRPFLRRSRAPWPRRPAGRATAR